MADRPYYQLNDNPDYNEQIPQLLDTDPASASKVFNPLIQMILNNIKATHTLAQQAAENGGYVMQATPPENTKILWFDSSTGTLKYYDDDTKTWKPIPAGTTWYKLDRAAAAGDPAPEGARIGDYALDNLGDIYIVNAQNKLDLAADGASVIRSDSEPTRTNVMWIDTANSNALKYYDGTSWTTVPAVWG